MTTIILYLILLEKNRIIRFKFLTIYYQNYDIISMDNLKKKWIFLATIHGYFLYYSLNMCVYIMNKWKCGF